MAIGRFRKYVGKDLKPTAMEALKRVQPVSLTKRPNDRIGLVVYAAESYTKTPRTSDKAIVQEAIKSIKYDNVLERRNWNWNGIGDRCKPFENSKAKSKVIILLTDGLIMLVLLSQKPLQILPDNTESKSTLSELEQMEWQCFLMQSHRMETFCSKWWK